MRNFWCQAQSGEKVKITKRDDLEYQSLCANEPLDARAIVCSHARIRSTRPKRPDDRVCVAVELMILIVDDCAGVNHRGNISGDRAPTKVNADARANSTRPRA